MCLCVITSLTSNSVIQGENLNECCVKSLLYRRKWCPLELCSCVTASDPGMDTQEPETRPHSFIGNTRSINRTEAELPHKLHKASPVPLRT